MTAELKPIQFEQPTAFEFTKENFKAAEEIIARYPEGFQQSAVMPLLDIAQRQAGGWLPQKAIEYVASILSMPVIRVHEVATFYSMYNLQPIGKHFVQVCTTTPCWLKGSDDVLGACEAHLGVKCGETTEDGEFTLTEVECLGACVNAPMVQIGDLYYEDLNPHTTVEILEALKRGEQPPAGSQMGRKTSEPITGPTTLQKMPGVKKYLKEIEQ